MKTAYEKRCKYGVNAYIFGKPKRRYAKLYWVLLGIVFLIGLMIDKL